MPVETDWTPPKYGFGDKNSRSKGLLAQNMNATPQETSVPKTKANQNWAKGNLDIRDDGVYFTPPGNQAGPNTVEGRMQGLLSSGSPYIESARQRAAQAAQRRGLLNSAMAASAGEKAAIESALPIVQQDAGALQEQDLTRLRGDIESRHIGERGDVESRLLGESGDIESRHIGERGDVESRLVGQRGDIESRLQSQQGEIQERLYRTQGDISSKIQREQGDIQAMLQRQKANYDERLAQMGYTHEAAMNQADIEWKQLDLESRMQVEYDRMSQENKQTFNELTSAISEDYMNDYIELLINPNFKSKEDREAAIKVLNENTQKRYELAGSVAGVDLTWEGTPGQAEPPGPKESTWKYKSERDQASSWATKLSKDKTGRPKKGESKNTRAPSPEL